MEWKIRIIIMELLLSKHVSRISVQESRFLNLEKLRFKNVRLKIVVSSTTIFLLINLNQWRMTNNRVIFGIRSINPLIGHDTGINDNYLSRSTTAYVNSYINRFEDIKKKKRSLVQPILVLTIGWLLFEILRIFYDPIWMKISWNLIKRTFVCISVKLLSDPSQPYSSPLRIINYSLLKHRQV